MSRILKRPMFRRGGPTNTGIMSGLVDRTKHAENPFVGSNIDLESLKGNTAALEAILEQYTPKTRLPIGEFGLNLASGMTLTDALRDPYKRFTRADDAREAAIRGGAAKLAIGQALKSDKIGTLKQGRNTSNQTLFGVKPGETGFFTIKQLVAGQGLIQPIDTRMAFTFDADTNTLSQRPVSEIDAMNENKRNAQEIVGAVNTVGQIKDKMIAELKNTPTGPVGSLYGILEATSDQFSQATQALGFNKNSLDFDINTSEKLDKYLEGKGVTKGAANYAKMKGSVINLAYLLAKIKEPGNPRLSEGDIIRQLDRLKFGASKDVFAATLNNVFDDEVIGARGQITGYGLDPDDFFNTGKSKKTTTGTTVTQDKDSNYNPLGFDESRLSPRAP